MLKPFSLLFLFLLVLTSGSPEAWAQDSRQQDQGLPAAWQSRFMTLDQWFASGTPASEMVILEWGGETRFDPEVMASRIPGQRGAVFPPVFLEYRLAKQVTRQDLVRAGVVRLCPLFPEDKVDAYLQEKIREGGTLELSIQTWTTMSPSERDLRFAPWGAQPLASPFEGLGVYQYRVEASQVMDLAAHPSVRHISMAARDQSLDRESIGAQQAAPTLLSPVPDYTGRGVTVGIGDNASGIHHVDLKSRVLDFVPFPYENHGVHITGILGGRGRRDIQGQGMAPDARLINLFFSSVLARTPQLWEKYSMNITNNSYAARQKDCEYAGTYDLNSQAVDHLALKYPGVLHVFAAGNDGNETCAPYPHGFATVVGGYQPAKNGLVVTSTDHQYHHAWDASMGPLRDGRLKPEITAVGREVFSTIGVDSYFVSGGTSMASPQVAGAAALLTEKYRAGHGGTLPGSALLKALLMNGARDLGRKGPDFQFGFGFLDLERSLSMIQEGRFREGKLGWGEVRQELISVPPGVHQLKIMLYWHDYPSSPKAEKQLVQDLDLEVIDPRSVSHLPLILDPSPTGIWEEARPGLDRTNNVEQVVIDRPEAGDYLVRIRGFGLPEGDQDYVLVYDFVFPQLAIRYPVSHQAIQAEDTLLVCWNADGPPEDFLLEFSADDGQNWTLIESGIDSLKRTYRWGIPAVSTAKGRLRIRQLSSGRVSEVRDLIVNPAPLLVLDSIQCPGSVVLRSYPGTYGPPSVQLEIMDHEKGQDFEPVQPLSVDGKLWLPNLDRERYYLLRTRPLFSSGQKGYPSPTIKYRPNQGNCQGDQWVGDLGIVRVDTVLARRKYTRTDLRVMPQLRVQVQNLSPQPLSNIQIRLNGLPTAMSQQTFPVTLMAMESGWLGIDLDSSLAPGIYPFEFQAVALSDTDPHLENNSLEDTLYYFPNPPVLLPLEFNFEELDEGEWRTSTYGLDSGRHWDFIPVQDTGRLRSAILPGMAIEGQRSLSLDAWKSVEEQENALEGTFNLSQYQVDRDEIRMDFRYILHGMPKFPQENAVWMRGSEEDPWKLAMVLPGEETGRSLPSGTLSLNDVLQGQSFSTSAQIKIVQKDSSLIAEPQFGSGLTLDQIRIFPVYDDVHLKALLSPQPVYCGQSAPVPVKIRVYNGVYNDLSNIRLFYRLNDQEPVEETLAFLAAKDSLDFEFSRPVLLETGQHRLQVWAYLDSDTYPYNDSLEERKIFNQPSIQDFPYREGFESNDGYWYTEGKNSSWAWGAPRSVSLRSAYEGAKVWKTGIQGRYNNYEQSYLYSPCFSIHALSHPHLQFHMVEDVEDCGDTYCDGAYMEYRLDGGPWQRLGAYGQGVNWYSDSLYQVWNQENKLSWKQAQIELPKGNSIQLRFVMESDMAYTKEGLAIDWVEVMDSPHYNDELMGVYPNPVEGGEFVIQWRSRSGDPLHITLHDLEGRLLHQVQRSSEPGLNRARIQTPTWAPGLYLLTIQWAGKKEFRKLIYW